MVSFPHRSHTLMSAFALIICVTCFVHCDQLGVRRAEKHSCRKMLNRFCAPAPTERMQAGLSLSSCTILLLFSGYLSTNHSIAGDTLAGIPRHERLRIAGPVRGQRAFSVNTARSKHSEVTSTVLLVLSGHSLLPRHSASRSSRI